MEYIEDLIKRGNNSFLMGMETEHKFYYEESIEIYKKILDVILIPAILTNLGTAFKKIGNDEKAIFNYTKSLKSKEYNSNKLKSITFFNRGTVNHSIGKIKNATNDYKNSILFDVNNYMPHNSLGAIYNKNKYYINAVEKYNDALLICSDSKMINNIKNNIKNSKENMFIFLDIIANKKLKSLYKKGIYGQKYNLN